MATQTTLFPPPVRNAGLAVGIEKFLFTLQMLLPLIVLDSTAGPLTEALPPAGYSGGATTGQSNQNMEITYRLAAGGNTATITGSIDGAITLTTTSGAGSVVKFKSDGTDWYVTKWP